MSKPQIAAYPLGQVRQFVQKSFYIQLLTKIGLKFNKKVPWATIITNNIAISNNIIFLQSMMDNFYTDFMPGEEVIQKPRGNIFTDDFRITVSRMRDARHVPQCKNQTKLETNNSFSLLVIINAYRDNHLPNQHSHTTTHDL